MDERSPDLAHTIFELDNDTPLTHCSTLLNADRSGSVTAEESSTDLVFPDLGLHDINHSSPLFPNADLNASNHALGDEWGDSLQLDLGLESPPAPSHTGFKAKLQRDDPIVSTSQGDDIQDSVFDNMQDKSRHSFRGARRKLCVGPTCQHPPEIPQVCEYCAMDMLN